jgi:hypothetical protein
VPDSKKVKAWMSFENSVPTHVRVLEEELREILECIYLTFIDKRSQTKEFNLVVISGVAKLQLLMHKSMVVDILPSVDLLES